MADLNRELEFCTTPVLKLRSGRKSRSLDTPVNRLTYRLYKKVLSARNKWYFGQWRTTDAAARPVWTGKCLRLREFSKQSAEDWFNVAWAALLEEHKGQPETDPELRVIGAARASRARRSGADDQYIRSGIREKVRDAFLRLAP